ASIRARGPVALVELPGGVPAWSATDADALQSLLADPRVSKDPRRHWPAFNNGEITADWPMYTWVAVDSMFTAYGADHRRLRKCVDTYFDTSTGPEDALANYLEEHRLVSELVAYRTEHPGDDITSVLVTTRDEEGSQLTQKELVDTLMLIINAGHETTVNLL